jgi:hypothetical protein
LYQTSIWTRMSKVFPEMPQRPAAVVFVDDKATATSHDLFERYKNHGEKRWKSIEECPVWIDHDLFSFLTGWDSTLEVVRLFLNNHHEVSRLCFGFPTGLINTYSGAPGAISW